MKDFILTAEEIQELHAARLHAKSRKDVNAAYKIHSIILLGTGMLSYEVSEVLFMNIDSLGNYVKKYLNGGIKELCKSNYLGRKQTLKEDQLFKLTSELDSKVYLTTKEVKEYISSTFNVHYSIAGINALLKRLGFVYKKPKLIPANPDINEQELFLELYEKYDDFKTSCIDFFRNQEQHMDEIKSIMGEGLSSLCA